MQRTYSHSKGRGRNGFEELDFVDALAAEDDRVGEADRSGPLADPSYYSYAHEHTPHACQSEYDVALRRWLEHYGRERFLVLPAEDYYKDPRASLGRALDSLGSPRAQAVGHRRDPQLSARQLDRSGRRLSVRGPLRRAQPGARATHRRAVRLVAALDRIAAHRPPPGGPDVEVRRSGSRHNDQATKIVCAIVLVMLGMRTSVHFLGLSAGTLVALLLVPVWAPHVRRFRGGRLVIAVSLACMVWGYALMSIAASEMVDTVNPSDRTQSITMFMSIAVGVGAIFWGRTVMSLEMVGLWYGVGLVIDAWFIWFGARQQSVEVRLGYPGERRRAGATPGGAYDPRRRAPRC